MEFVTARHRNGKLEVVYNQRGAESDSEDDHDEEKEMPEATGCQTYDTPERDLPGMTIRTNPEADVIQIHTDSDIPQDENTEPIVRRSTQKINKLNRSRSIPSTASFW